MASLGGRFTIDGEVLMPEAIRSLLQSKRALIALMTAIFDAVLVIVLAVGYGVDPEQAREVWTPLIAALATVVSALATVIIAAYTKRDPESARGGDASRGGGPEVLGIVLVAMGLGLSGCAMGSLRAQAEDHYVQTRTIADACRDQSRGFAYPEAPCSADLQADLDAMAKQAECVLSITKGEPCRID